MKSVEWHQHPGDRGNPLLQVAYVGAFGLVCHPGPSGLSYLGIVHFQLDKRTGHWRRSPGAAKRDAERLLCEWVEDFHKGVHELMLRLGLDGEG